MVSATAIALLGSAFVFSLLLEFFVLMWVQRFNVLAVPNSRSFHTVPKPTIGGVAIVVPVLVFLALKALDGVDAAMGLVFAGGLLAVIGLWDDLRDLSSKFRFFCHISAVAVVVWSLQLDWSIAALGIAGFLLVWHVNLFNFMDGIDGIASVQVVVYCLGAQLLTGGIPGWLGELDWLLIGATLGFLAYNWPPAKIFMGDVGSGFLGLILAALALQLGVGKILPFVASLILLAGFWFDASYTLCVRMMTGQKFTQAHRSHIYQKVAERIGHLWTTIAFLAFAGLWLMPLAGMSLAYPSLALFMLALAILPLAYLGYAFEAGRPTLDGRDDGPVNGPDNGSDAGQDDEVEDD